MKLISIKNNIGYIENSCNIGYIIIEDYVILIDSGLEDVVAKKIFRIFDNQAYKIKAIINTHSHADHCGGNNYMQNKLGALIYAPEFESAIIENPYLEPVYLSGGAAPLKELTSKFIMAKPSKVDYVIKKEDTEICIESVTLKIVPLPGHAINHIGIAIDDVLYCGDSILDGELLMKHKIPFNVDIGQQINTLKILRESKYEVYIPSHCTLMNKKELSQALDENIRTIEDINNIIVESLNTPKTLEEIEYSLFKHYNIRIKSLTQYYLLKTTILAHINYLFKENIIMKIVNNNKICWIKATL